jgi:hypothetical protein
LCNAETDRWAERRVLKRRWGKRKRTKDKGREKDETSRLRNKYTVSKDNQAFSLLLQMHPLPTKIYKAKQLLSMHTERTKIKRKSEGRLSLC